MKYIAPEYKINKIESEDVITGSRFQIFENVEIKDSEGNVIGSGNKGEYSVDIEDLFG
jgi:hypothetical protein